LEGSIEPTALWAAGFCGSNGLTARLPGPDGRAHVDLLDRTQPRGSEELDAFFAEESRFKPNYRRIFRSPERGSVIVDLLDPVRY
jgi:hypothetical protein